MSCFTPAKQQASMDAVANDGELAQLRESLYNRVEAITRLEEEKEADASTISIQAAKIEKLTDEVRELGMEITATRNVARNLLNVQKDLEDKNARLADRSAENAALKQSLGSQRAEIERQKTTISVQKSAIAALKEEKGTLQEEIDRKQMVLNKKDLAIDGEREALYGLQVAYDDLEKAHSEFNTSIANLQRDVKAKVAEMVELERENSVLRTEADKYQHDFGAKDLIIAELQHEVKAKEATIAQMKGAMSAQVAKETHFKQLAAKAIADLQNRLAKATSASNQSGATRPDQPQGRAAGSGRPANSSRPGYPSSGPKHGDNQERSYGMVQDHIPRGFGQYKVPPQVKTSGPCKNPEHTAHTNHRFVHTTYLDEETEQIYTKCHRYEPPAYGSEVDDVD